MTTEQVALRLLSIGLIDIRATAWGEVAGTDPAAQLARIEMIADALHNIPSAITAGTVAETLERVMAEQSPGGCWLALALARARNVPTE